MSGQKQKQELNSGEQLLMVLPDSRKNHVTCCHKYRYYRAIRFRAVS